MTDRKYWLYLAKVKGMESGRRRMLLDIFGTPEEIFKASESTLRGLPLLEDYHIEQLIGFRKLDFEAEEGLLEEKGIGFITENETVFPERLKNIPDAPSHIFYRGDFACDGLPAVAVVGSRKCSFYGREMCIMFSKRLAEAGITVISGMAAGVDGFAHRGALEAGGRTVAVLGSGVDICYPSQNRDIYDALSLGNGGGCIMSEYYPGDKPLPYNFPQRNRIISGLADILLVVEAGKKSGTFITVDHALEQGKDIFAIPGRIGDTVSDGCNSLIKGGAHMATDPDDLIEELKGHYEILLMAEKSRKKKNRPDLMPEEMQVYDALSFIPRQINEIAEETGLSIGTLSGILIELEMKGLIEEAVKNMYVKLSD